MISGGVPASPDGAVALWPAWLDKGLDDGQSLMYQFPPGRTVGIVDVALPGISFSNRQTLMTYGGNAGQINIAPIPDSNRFVIVRAASAGGDGAIEDVEQSSIIVVQNFRELLKERVR